MANALSGTEKYKHITPDQVAEAFIRGKEVCLLYFQLVGLASCLTTLSTQTMAVYTLKCVGYDATFQCNLAEKFPTWVPPPRKPKAEKKKRANKNVRASKKEGASKAPAQASKKSGEKRKRVDLESDSEDSENDYLEEEEEEEEENYEPMYIPRGTRSRPILL